MIIGFQLELELVNYHSLTSAQAKLLLRNFANFNSSLTNINLSALLILRWRWTRTRAIR